jgi:hypothetical protein
MWDRLKVIAAIVGDVEAQAIVMLFYFTILVPFGLISRLTSDPLQRRVASAAWLERPDLPTDLESAKKQG